MQVEPGIYYDIPFEEYKTWDAVNWSKLKLAKKSPLHFLDSHPIEPTKAMRLGSGVHDGFLEPDRVAREYAVMPNFSTHPDNKTKDGKQSNSHATKFVEAAEREFINENAGKTIVPQTEYDAITGCVAALKRNPVVAKLVKSGNPEVSIVWYDDEFAMLCKCRIDWLDVDGMTAYITDLKTTADCMRFEKQIHGMDYNGQMAFYRRAIEATIGLPSVVSVIAVEPQRPFGNMAAPMDGSDLTQGGLLCVELLGLIADCRRTGIWYGYSNPDRWKIPEYLTRKNDDELVEVGE